MDCPALNGQIAARKSGLHLMYTRPRQQMINDIVMKYLPEKVCSRAAQRFRQSMSIIVFTNTASAGTEREREGHESSERIAERIRLPFFPFHLVVLYGYTDCKCVFFEHNQSMKSVHGSHLHALLLSAAPPVLLEHGLSQTNQMKESLLDGCLDVVVRERAVLTSGTKCNVSTGQALPRLHERTAEFRSLPDCLVGSDFPLQIGLHPVCRNWEKKES
jgi:hypothetical protein